MNRVLTYLASAILIVVGAFFSLTGIGDLLSGAFPGWIEAFAGVSLLGAGVALMKGEFPTPLRTSLSPSIARFMNRFRLWYVVANTALAVPCMLALAWIWSRPNPEYNGGTFSDFLEILIVAALIINSVSYRKQAALVRGVLTAPQHATPFQIVPFSFQFYWYNLRSALVTSGVLFIPLTFLIFYFAPLPIIFWFIPYHLITGLLIGADLKRWLQSELHKR